MTLPVAPEHSAQRPDQGQVSECQTAASQRPYTGSSSQRKGDPEVPDRSWEGGGAGGDQTDQGPHWPLHHVLGSR